MLGNLLTAIVVLFLLLAGTAIGAAVRRRLPDHMLDDGAKDVVRLSMALLASIAALVLSLLINSSYGVYEGQRSDLRTLAADVINLDNTLRLYGEEARPTRVLLRQGMVEAIGHLWSRPSLNTFAIEGSSGEKAYLMLLDLVPRDEKQATLKAQALQISNQIAQSRLRLFERSEPDLPMSLLVILAAWLVCLFLSFSLFSPLKPTSIVALLLVALSISAALFLILELSEPFSGLVRLSDHPLTGALPAL